MRKTLVLIAYLAGVLLVFEGASRALLRTPYFARGNDDSSWRLRFVRRQRVGEARMAYDFDIPDPGRGWALKPGLRDVRAFPEATLSSNSRGIRGDTEYPYERSEGKLRILVLGDSFTFGEEVGDREAYPACLARLLPGSEVLNLGVHGYGHDQMLLYLKSEGVKYKPDVVLLGFLYDDMERNLLGFRDYAKPRFELRGGALLLKNTPVPTPEETLAAEPYRSKFKDLLVMLLEGYRWRSGSNSRQMRQLTAAILDEMDRTISGIGARAVYAYLPVWGELGKPDENMTHRERFFFSYCQKRGIPSVYLTPFFLAKRKQGAVFKVYGHWGALEHETAAEGLKEALVAQGLIPRGNE
jgi:hypothetical protein